MNDGHRTSTIARPKSRPATRPVARPSNHANPLHDLTTPIDIDKRLVPQRRGRLIVALFGTVIALTIGAALFVLPVKSWFQQRDDLATRTGELEALNAANDQLQTEVDRLQTDAGIIEAAREEIDYVAAGEKRLTVLPIGAAPTVLPAGWPYDLITRIVALRQAEAVEAAAAAAAAVTTTVP